MASSAKHRGQELTDGARAMHSGPGWLARMIGGSGETLLDTIDRGLVYGSIDLTLPKGTRRLLGGRQEGFAATVHLIRWRGLLRAATAGSVGLYEGWEAGDWTSPDPVQLFAIFTENALSLGNVVRPRGPWRWIGRALNRLRRNSKAGAERNIHAHYDLGNDFYEAWLGGSMAYSSALFEQNAQQHMDELDHGQLAKIAAIAGRAKVGAGQRVLEIGCGWGAQATALSTTGAEVVAISLSDEQLDYCRKRIPDGAAIDYRKQDYRDVAEPFDAIVSVEMVEAVGREYWPAFFDCLNRNLKPGGRAVLQFITLEESLFDAYASGADFIQTFIFPGGILIRESAFRALAAERGLDWTDQFSFGEDYAETLALWHANFDLAIEEGRLPTGFDDRFKRLWQFYLMYCEGGFRGGLIDVHQVTLIKRA